MNKAILLGMASLFLGACTSERVVLLPSADGAPGAVVIRDKAGEIRLDQPYSAVRRTLDSNRVYQSSSQEVSERYGPTLAVQPPRPSAYILYFETGGNVLTAESTAALKALRTEIAERPASEVLVIGHTDRVGSVDGNDKLSLKRAELIRGVLIESGVDAGKLETIGRGERDPLVPTADEVDEPRNRRVEINVR